MNRKMDISNTPHKNIVFYDFFLDCFVSDFLHPCLVSCRRRLPLARMPYFGSCRQEDCSQSDAEGRERREDLGWGSAPRCFFYSRLWISNFFNLCRPGAALLLGSFDSPSVMRWTLWLRGEDVPADGETSPRESGDKEVASLASRPLPSSRKGFRTPQASHPCGADTDQTAKRCRSSSSEKA